METGAVPVNRPFLLFLHLIFFIFLCKYYQGKTDLMKDGHKEYIRIFILFLLIFNLSCLRSNNEMEARMDLAETIINEYPDSALVILSEINHDELQNRKEKAFYGLLLTMAQDKNHLNPRNDSIISFSEEYFSNSGDIPNEIKSLYYRGRVLYHREEYPLALVNFFKAKELAEKNRDLIFWAGMSSRGIADIYHIYSDFSDELYYSKKELEFIEESKVQPYLNYSLLDLAFSYYNNLDFRNSLEIANQLLDSAAVSQDNNLHYESIRLIGLNHYWMGDYNQSMIDFEKNINSGLSDSEDSVYLALNYIEVGKTDDAERIIRYTSDLERPLKNYALYKIYKDRKDYETSLSELEKLYNKSNNIKTKSKTQDHNVSLTDYYTMLRKNDENKIERQRLKIYLIIAISLIILISSCGITIRLKRRHRKEIEKKLMFEEELRRSLNQSNIKAGSFRNFLKEIMDHNRLILEKGMEAKLGLNKTTKNSDTILNIINEFSVKGKLFPQLEEYINLEYENILLHLKEDIPDLKDRDYHLFIYSVLGFSSNMIVTLMNEDKIETIYNRRRHLKDKIKKHSPENRDLYLKYI